MLILTPEPGPVKTRIENSFRKLKLLTPTLRNKSPTMLSAEIRVDGVKFWVPENVVCRGVPCGEGLALMRGEDSMAVTMLDNVEMLDVGLVSPFWPTAAPLAEVCLSTTVSFCFLFCLLSSE